MTRADGASGGVVRLRAGSAFPPATRVERLVIAELRRGGARSLRDVARRVGGALYREALRGGGWALDVGLLGEGPFVAEATRALLAGDGGFWVVERIHEENDADGARHLDPSGTDRRHRGQRPAGDQPGVLLDPAGARGAHDGRVHPGRAPGEAEGRP
jgi:hypothetical protein